MTHTKDNAGREPARWLSLAGEGFSKYEVNQYAEIRPVGGEVRVTNDEGGLDLVGDDGDRHFRAAGKLCRLVHGPQAPGATVPRTKLTAAQVRAVRRRRKAPVVLAAEMGVSTSTIKAIRQGQTWRSVDASPPARYESDGQAIGA